MLANISDSSHTLPGAYRNRLPTQTLERLFPVMEKIGVTRVADVTGMDKVGIPVITCIRPYSKNISVSQGKGLTFELAQISAMMEAVESFYLENPPPRVTQGKYIDLAKNHLIENPRSFNQNIRFDDNLEKLKLNWIE